MTNSEINEIFQSVANDDPEVHLRFARAIREAVIAECAAVCERLEDEYDDAWRQKYDPHDGGKSFGAGECAEAIRALKEPPHA